MLPPLPEIAPPLALMLPPKVVVVSDHLRRHFRHCRALHRIGIDRGVGDCRDGVGMRQRAAAMFIAADENVASAIRARRIERGRVKPYLVGGHGDRAAGCAAHVIVSRSENAAVRPLPSSEIVPSGAFVIALTLS